VYKRQARITTKTKRDLEQVHICLGVPSFPVADNRRFALAVFNNILGGGMASRLFQNIREKQGLAYAVFSDLTPYRDAGLLSIYAGTARETAGRLLRSVAEEFRNLKQQPVTKEELRRAKDHLKGSLLLSLESTNVRMSNLAREEIYFGRFFTLDEVLRATESVTREHVQEIVQELLRPEQIGVTVLGNLQACKVTREQLAC